LVEDIVAGDDRHPASRLIQLTGNGSDGMTATERISGTAVGDDHRSLAHGMWQNRADALGQPLIEARSTAGTTAALGQGDGPLGQNLEDQGIKFAPFRQIERRVEAITGKARAGP
jgi:hypothetical protein